MSWIGNAISKRKEKLHKNAVEDAKIEACRLFQIKEYNSLLWLTFDGFLIAPFSMMCKGEDANECVALLNAIRDMYVERVANENKR